METRTCRTCSHAHSWQYDWVSKQWQGQCSACRCLDCRDEKLFEEFTCGKWSEK